MNDLITILHRKDEGYKSYSLKMFCDEYDAESHASVNIADGPFDEKTWDMLVTLAGEHATDGLLNRTHMRVCKSCPRRVKGFVGVLRMLLKANIKHYTYQYAVSEPIDFNETDPVSSASVKIYTVDVHKYESVLDNPAAYLGVANELQSEAQGLPGVMNTSVKYPCDPDDCVRQVRQGVIYNIIMHLNDYHKWTREQIADWLDSVHDPENGVDLAFKVPEKEEV